MLLLLEFQRFQSKKVWIGSFAARGSAKTLFWSFWSAETLFWSFGHHSFHHVLFKESCRNGIIWSCKVAVEVNSKLFMCLLKPLLTSWAINLPRHKFLCAHLDRKEVKLVTRDSEITPMVNLIEEKNFGYLQITLQNNFAVRRILHPLVQKRHNTREIYQTTSKLNC